MTAKKDIKHKNKLGELQEWPRSTVRKYISFAFQIFLIKKVILIIYLKNVVMNYYYK